MEVKKSLVPVENNEITVAGGVQRCPPIPDIYASTAPSYSLAKRTLIGADIWIYAGEEWLGLKAEMERTSLSSFHLFSHVMTCGCCIKMDDELGGPLMYLLCVNLWHQHNRNVCWWIVSAVAVKLLMRQDGSVGWLSHHTSWPLARPVFERILSYETWHWDGAVMEIVQVL